jgi:tetratricopeptide (TPR) repeat protein
MKTFIAILSFALLSLAATAQSQGDLNYYNIGVAYIERGDFLKAIDNFTIYLKSHPNESHAYFLRGYSRVELGNYYSGIADVNIAINLNGNVADYYNMRAWAYCFTGDYNSAITDANKAISLEKKGAYYDTRATAYGLKLSFYSALSDFNNAISTESKALYYYKRGLVKKANNDLSGAEQDFAAARKLEPSGDYKRGRDPFFSFFNDDYFAGRNKTTTSTTTTSFDKFTYTVKYDGFTIKFPGYAHQETSSSASFTTNFTASYEKGSEAYMIHYLVEPGPNYEWKDDAGVLKTIRESFAQALRATISDVQTFSFRNHTGVIYKLKMPDKYAIFKDIRIVNKTYRLSLINAYRFPTTEEFDAFYNTLQISY